MSSQSQKKVNTYESERREKLRLSNRLSAGKRRYRERVMLEVLERKERQLSTDNDALSRANESIREVIGSLKKTIKEQKAANISPLLTPVPSMTTTSNPSWAQVWTPLVGVSPEILMNVLMLQSTLTAIPSVITNNPCSQSSVIDDGTRE